MSPAEGRKRFLGGVRGVAPGAGEQPRARSHEGRGWASHSDEVLEQFSWVGPKSGLRPHGEKHELQLTRPEFLLTVCLERPCFSARTERRTFPFCHQRVMGRCPPSATAPTCRVPCWRARRLDRHMWVALYGLRPCSVPCKSEMAHASFYVRNYFQLFRPFRSLRCFLNVRGKDLLTDHGGGAPQKTPVAGRPETGRLLASVESGTGRPCTRLVLRARSWETQIM